MVPATHRRNVWKSATPGTAGAHPAPTRMSPLCPAQGPPSSRACLGPGPGPGAEPGTRDQDQASGTTEQDHGEGQEREQDKDGLAKGCWGWGSPATCPPATHPCGQQQERGRLPHGPELPVQQHCRGDALAGPQAGSIGAGAQRHFHGPDLRCDALTSNSRERGSG